MCPATVRILFLTLQLIIRQHRSCQLKTAVRLNRKLISDGTCAFRWKHVKNVRWGRLRRLFAETMDKNSKYSGIQVFQNCYFDHAKGAVTREEWQKRFLRATQHLQHGRLAYISRAQIFHEREARSVEFLSFLRQKRAREQELDLFPLQKIASSEVILARTICVPVACVVAFVCRRELSKYVKTNK